MADEASRGGAEARGDADGPLLERARRGDRTAFAALVHRHAGPLLRLARSLVREQAVAEEVVQETWLALVTGLAGFEGRSSLRTWLFQVVIHKARTRYAREGRSVPFSALGEAGAAVEPERFDEQGGWADPPGGWTDEDPERLALRAETRTAIEAAIAGLPEAQRAVLVLRDVEGLETDEICNLLGLTVTNQRVLLHRARARVRDALEKGQEPTR